jgi:hypothetical protein
VDLENQYYNSKALKEDDPKAALESFQKVCSVNEQHFPLVSSSISGARFGRKRQRRMGLQSAQADDQDQLQTGE